MLRALNAVMILSLAQPIASYKQFPSSDNCKTFMSDQTRLIVSTALTGCLMDVPLREDFLHSVNQESCAMVVAMDLTVLLKKSQLHGINRLAERKYRLAWAVALVLLLVSAIMSLLITFWRYQSNPTFITRLENIRYDMAFPTVLICPELDFPNYKMEEFLDEVDIPPSLNKTYLRTVLRQLAAFYSPDVLYTVRDLSNLEYLLNHNNLDVEEVAIRLTLSCKETLLRCRWRGENVNCSQFFHMEIMQFGFCCVFNGRSLKRELRNNLPIQKPVQKIFTNSIGYKSGLMLAINQKTVPKSIDLSYKWIIIAGGQRFVDAVTVNGSALSPGVEAWFGYKSTSFSVSEEAKLLSLELRRCRLSSEGLPHFPIYKKNYCRVECEMANLLKKCNCSLHTHPAPQHTHCKADALPCAKIVSKQTSFESCNCLTTCDVVYDDVVTTVYQLAPTKQLIDSFYDGLDVNRVSVVRVFVQQREENKRSRQSYFSSFDLFSQMGGIFNVFFGCSVLSLLELAQLVWYSFKNWRSSNETDSDKDKQSKKKRVRLNLTQTDNGKSVKR